MEPKDFYKFCPKCGGNLIPDLGNSLICSNCSFKLFINSSACVGAIIENSEGDILLLKRTFDPGKGGWDLPGGFMNPDETVEEAIRRELKEEIGVEAKIGKIISSFPARYKYQNIKVPLLNIFVTAKLESNDIKAGDDAASFEFVPKNKVLSYEIWESSVRSALTDYLMG